MKRWLIALIPIFGLGALVSWRLQLVAADTAAKEKVKSERGKTAPLVSVTPAVVRDYSRTYTAIGTIESPHIVPIASKVSGRLMFLTAREGDRVTTGQLLARIDASEVDADVRREKAALAEARSRLAQAQLTQGSTDVGIDSQIRQREAAVTSANADMVQAQETNVGELEEAAAAVRDVIGRIQSAEAGISSAQADIRSAQANLENAQVKLGRVQALFNQGFIAAQDVDDARTTVSVHKSTVDAVMSKRNSAQAQRASAEAQKVSAERRVDVVRSRGKANIEAARAKVAEAKAALDVAQANVSQRPAYRAGIAALSANVAASHAAVLQAEARRSETELRSPLDGFVTARTLDPGAMASPGQPILTVQALSQVWMTASVPEDVSRKVTVGMPAEIELDGLPEKRISGHVVQVNPSADVLSRQFTIRVGLSNAGAAIKPGMFGRVHLVVERILGAVMIPREAVKDTLAGRTVTVVGVDGKAEIRQVVIGASDPTGYVVQSGLAGGENVIVMSAGAIKDGANVRVNAAKPATVQKEK